MIVVKFCHGLRISIQNQIVKIVESGLSFFLFFFLIFIFAFDLFFTFSIFRTLGLGLEVIGHTVTLVTSDGVVTTLITRLERRE